MTIKAQTAFSLVELMVTFAIVLIISILAYPVLKTYFVQSKVTDAVQSASQVQAMISNQIATGGTVTGSGSGLSTPTTISRYVASYSISANGVISITTTADAGGIGLTLTPAYNTTTEQVTWTCAVTSATNDSSVPVECRI